MALAERAYRSHAFAEDYKHFDLGFRVGVRNAKSVREIGMNRTLSVLSSVAVVLCFATSALGQAEHHPKVHIPDPESNLDFIASADRAIASFRSVCVRKPRTANAASPTARRPSGRP